MKESHIPANIVKDLSKKIKEKQLLAHVVILFQKINKANTFPWVTKFLLVSKDRFLVLVINNC